MSVCVCECVCVCVSVCVCVCVCVSVCVSEKLIHKALTENKQSQPYGNKIM